MKTIKSLSFAVLGLAILQATASAETVHGLVQNFDAATNTLAIRRVETDKNQNLPTDLQLVVNRDAKLKNIASLQELQRDNEVKVDVKQNKDLGIWEAKSVELNQTAAH